jgi:D-alanyl-D-alanine-carboxypeptidase/D-alanyl-D-alanine-endopeptidase
MTTPPAADRIAAVLADQIDVRRKSVGMAAGVVSPAGRHVVVHGSAGSDAPLDGDTAFELASIGKVFTGLLFADAVRRGEVRLDDPVDTLLPGGMNAPTWKGRRLTLLHLATHTAGLAVHPPDVPTLADPRLADYSVDNLLQSLCAFTPTRPPGTWEYSNWDISVLGQLLALRAGVEFETLVEQRITKPLGMANTAIERTSRLRLSSGHSPDLAVIPRLRLGSLAPAGGFVSTANDMLTLASALLGLSPSPLAGLLDVATSVRRPIRPSLARLLKENWRLMLRMFVSPPPGARPPDRFFSGAEAGLAWFIFTKGDRELVAHDGSALGCSGSLVLDRRLRAAVVVLSNTGVMIHDVARHLMWGDYALSRTRTEVAVESSVLDRYIGTYQMPRGGPAVGIKHGDRGLTLTFPVVGPLVMRAENDHEFFLPELDCEIRFAATGPVRELVMQPGRSFPSFPIPRVSDAA